MDKPPSLLPASTLSTEAESPCFPPLDGRKGVFGY